MPERSGSAGRVTDSPVIRTPDQRLRVFVSSTLQEVADERSAAREAIEHLRLAPVMFELGARPHPPKDLYRAYLDQSHIFIGIYWQKYGWVAPDMDISGLEDEYRLSGDKPKLIYIKQPAPDREPRLKELLARIKDGDGVSYKYFSTADELRELIENDLALMLSEALRPPTITPAPAAPSRPVSNLPLPPNALIGREHELGLVRDLLLRDEVRLVTLTGTGGTGKSRLALEVARNLLDHFADGVFLIRLAPLHDAALVVAAIAETLEIRESSGAQPLLEMLQGALREKHLLLVLDNYEQVISAAPCGRAIAGGLSPSEDSGDQPHSLARARRKRSAAAAAAPAERKDRPNIRTRAAIRGRAIIYRTRAGGESGLCVDRREHTGHRRHLPAPGRTAARPRTGRRAHPHPVAANAPEAPGASLRHSQRRRA